MHPRLKELAAEAPVRERGVFSRVCYRGRDVYFLCGTLGAAFDAWQRRVALLSAADALFAQQIGLEKVERVMDGLEAEIRRTLNPGESLCPRRSPGYGEMPLALSRDIIAQLDATRRIGVSVTANDQLVPLKSVTAICEIKRDGR